jgi:starch phosphorylase
MERYVATLESIARRISDGKAVPAADLSEQISMAGNEASGTGNLKFALDRGNHNRDVGQRQRRDPGRRGTLSGLTAEELTRRKAEDYTPRNESRAARGDRPHQFRILFERGSRTVLAARRSLLSRDDHMLVADCQDYVECQERVNQAYADCNAWTRMFIFNCARVGRFSSDRSIREYCRDICKVTPIIFDEGRAGCGP